MQTCQPCINTSRLLLRPLEQADAATVRRLAGDRAIADTTLNIPHPYEVGMAEAWIDSLHSGFEAGEVVTFALVLHGESQPLGAIGLRIDRSVGKADLGYWIGKPYWNSGYATEAVRALLAYAFNDLDLSKITARHLARNPASGRVMQKVGMRLEGLIPRDTIKWGKYEDVVYYCILREDWG